MLGTPLYLRESLGKGRMLGDRELSPRMTSSLARHHPADAEDR